MGFFFPTTISTMPPNQPSTDPRAHVKALEARMKEREAQTQARAERYQ